MLRHIVPVLRNGCSVNSHSLRRSLAPSSVRSTTSFYISVIHASRDLHTQLPLHRIHNQDDITEPLMEAEGQNDVVDQIYENEVIQPSDVITETVNEDDLTIVREVISSGMGAPPKKQTKQGSGSESLESAQAKKIQNAKLRRKQRRKAERGEKLAQRAGENTSNPGPGSIAHAMGLKSLAQRLSASSSSELPTPNDVAGENGTSMPEHVPDIEGSTSDIVVLTEEDTLKKGAAKVLKNIPGVQDILTKSLKKKKKKSAASKKAEASVEGSEDKGEDKAAQPGKKKKEKKEKKPEDKKEKPAGKKKSAKASSNQEKVDVKTIRARDLNYTQVEQGEEVAKLCHGLERVLFNPGVYHLQDPRSGVFNFDPSLAKIMPVNEFDFRALKEYVTSSKDTNLAGKAKAFAKKYSGSTSSMTSSVSQFHFLLSGWRPIAASNMSRGFKAEPLTFTRITRAPSASFLHYNDGTYAMDADKEFDSPNILSMLGKSMEKLLTLEPKDFDRYHRSRSSEISEEERNAEEAFSFATLGDFMIRSQLDANDKRLPGVGNFDLKTRAVVSIRMDMTNFKDACGYEIKGRYGNWESFEKEYFDMIRSAFLKYSLQVRMGLMDGIFVAYHNINRIFGFQYISLNEMDSAIHGTEETALGDAEFKLSLQLLNEMLNIVTEKYPKQSLRLHIETRPTTPPLMYFFAEPVTKEEIHEIQNANKDEIMRFENQMMAYKDDLPATDEKPTAVVEAEGEAEVEAEAETECSEVAAQGPDEDEGAWSSEAVWSEVTSKAEEAVESEELGLPYVRRAIQIALRQSGLLQNDATGQQGREYVQDLLETLTGTQGEAEAEDIEPTEEGVDDQNTFEQPTVEEVAVKGEIIGECSGETLPETAEKLEDASPAEEISRDAATDTTEQAEDIAIREAMEAEEAIDYSRPEHPGQSSLKDLIRHLAEQADEYQPPSKDEAAPDSLNKLREFERILSELVVENRTSESKGDSKATTTSSEATADTAADEVPAEDLGELTGLILTIKNKVDGKYVTRPDRFTRGSKWDLEYNIQEMDKGRAWRLYNQVKDRRKKTLQKDDSMAETDSEYARAYQRMLAQFSAAGRSYRRRVDHEAKNKPLYFLKPQDLNLELKWGDVFERSLAADVEAKNETETETQKSDEEPRYGDVHESLKEMDSLVIEPEEDVQAEAGAGDEDAPKESK
ncbi:mRNA degradation protein pet127, mitochondrial [Ceratocystis fimbriata CBS 114723]|uniref:mRNA degradation protein pet127, mitochondrial n=1 Tax=Ceratocystis fimbriata CBS 114723 TaxID=1035309 RepID=A0A2C5X3X6_9PEZI|nr:mRNA degradation protein pet127, mitochondrial [Ceratocystis fimbriata CBS 114723]